MNELTWKTRREFLRAGILGASAAWTLPSFLSETFNVLGAEAAGNRGVTGKDGTILVVLQMAGGNDGLNTVAPYANDFYRKARPNLGLKPANLLKLNDEFGLHPALSGLKELHDEGWLSIVQGVGYPNPNRSHFRSMEIWQTASDANKAERHGWLGRYFDSACKGAEPTVGISVGRQTPQAFASPRPVGVSLENPESYRFASTDRAGEGETAASGDFFSKLNGSSMENEMDMNSGGSIGMLPGAAQFTGSPLDFLERTALDAQISSEKILAVSKKGTNQASYPASQLANSLKLVARLIAGGLPTRVYYVSQGGYDTHTNQVPAHQRLLTELGGSIKSFFEDLKAQGNAEQVLLMTFSEFGRRVAENANNGTDHGAAAPLFLAGPKVKPGFHGRFPSLAPKDLQNGDPRFTSDFRSVYAGALEQWLKCDSTQVLGRRFTPLDII